MKDLFKVNLQLFAEDDNQDGVVDHQGDDINIDYNDNSDSYDSLIDDNIDNSSEEVEGEESKAIDENEEVVEPQSEEGQSPEENAQFKKMRLKAEEQAKKKFENERLELENVRRELEELKRQNEEASIRKEVFEEITPEKVSQVAYDMGVSEEYARKLLNSDAEKEINRKKIERYETIIKLEQQKQEVKNKKYFKFVEKEVDEMFKNTPNADYKTVYNFVVGQKIEELEAKVTKDVEKRTIANIHDRSRRKNIGNSDGGSNEVVNPSSILSNQGMEMASIFGNDPREIAKYVTEKTKRKRG